MTDVASLVELAAECLSAQAGADVRLELVFQFDHNHTGARCRVETIADLPDTIFVKQSSAADNPRMLNEAASLRFLRDLDVPVVPQLILMDDGLVISADLGEHPTIQDYLHGQATPQAALSAMTAYGQALGEMQVVTRGHAAHFATIQAEYGAETPSVDANKDLHAHRDRIWQAMDLIQVACTDAFKAELLAVNTRMSTPGPFTVFCQNDLGDHNALFDGEHAYILDFEFGGFNHGLMDALQPRMANPAAYRGRAYPAEAVVAFENAYRATIAPIIHEAADEQVFMAAMADACGKMTFWQLAGFAHRVMKDGDIPQDLSPTYAFFTRKLIHFLNAFIEIGDTLPQMQAAAERIKDRVNSLWLDLPPFPTYRVWDANAERGPWETEA